MKLYFREILPHLGEMLEGLKYSLILTVISMGLGLVIGILACVMKNGKNKALRVIANAYIEIIRNTPLLVQLYILYFGLAEFGIDLSPFQASAIAMTINAGAYNAEIFRGGIISVNQGQYEASKALGLKPRQTMWYVVIPQMLRTVVPPVANETITLVKDTALVSSVALIDILKKAQQAVNRDMNVTAYLLAALIYLVITMVLTFAFHKTEKKLSISQNR